MRTAAHAEQVSHDGQRFTAALAGGEVLTAQRLLVATGRRADLAGLGLGAYGVGDTAGTLATDERMRAADGLWAVGDITGKGAFTHVSMYQAAIAVADILGQDGPAADYRAVPRVTFTDPEIGAVGLTEAQARQQGIGRADRQHPAAVVGARLDCTRPGTTDSSSSSRTRDVASWWARPPPGRPEARC